MRDFSSNYSEKGSGEFGLPHEIKCLFSCGIYDNVLVGNRLKVELKNPTAQADPRIIHNYAPVDLNSDITEIYYSIQI